MEEKESHTKQQNSCGRLIGEGGTETASGGKSGGRENGGQEGISFYEGI